MIGKDKKPSAAEPGTISTLLGRDTEIEGALAFKETIRVDGRIKGKLTSSKGTVIIGENAVIEADVQVGVAIIRGKVHGRVAAEQRIEIYAPAQVEGDICAPIVTIDSGVLFNGNCQMQAVAKVPEPKIQPVVQPAAKELKKEADSSAKKL
jgi:cytoskeletal protein CcmA (bactofilin family)